MSADPPRTFSRCALWAGLAAACLSAGCQDAEGDPRVVLYGTLYDAVPEVVFSDPAGTAGHRVPDGSLTAYSLEDPGAWDAAAEDPAAGLRVAEGSSSEDSPWAFQVEGPAVVEGAALTLVGAGPGRSPTAFTGVVPQVSDRYGWFRFFDGALFAEPMAVVADRVAALAPDRPQAAPDGGEVGNGCLVYGQLLSDPSLGPGGDTSPVEGARVAVRPWDGDGFGDAIPAGYLSAELARDPSLRATSGSGVFYAAGIPAGPVAIEVVPPGAAGAEGPPMESLCAEDGMIWLAAFFLPGQAPQAPSSE